MTGWYLTDEIAPGLHRITEPGVSGMFRANAYWVRGRDADLQFDFCNGVLPLRPALPIGDRPVIAVASHAHVDHVGGFHEFDDRRGHAAEAGVFATMDPAATFATEFRENAFGPSLLAVPAPGFRLADWRLVPAPLTRELGVVASSADDWSLSSVVWIFSVAIVFLGLAAAFAGKWLEEVGPRMVGVVAAFLWGGGFIIGSFGISMHQLWLIYLGYGVLGGCGLGLGYVSPVSTLIRWFPDRRGMATGMAIMGFGGGAMIAAPVKGWLLNVFQQAPDFLGAQDTVATVVENGRVFAETAAGKVEVVIASAAQAASFGGEAGVYVVGTGATGAAQTFLTLGVVYFVVMILAAFQYRVPAEGWKPVGWTPKPVASGMVSENDVHID